MAAVAINRRGRGKAAHKDDKYKALHCLALQSSIPERLRARLRCIDSFFLASIDNKIKSPHYKALVDSICSTVYTSASFTVVGDLMDICVRVRGSIVKVTMWGKGGWWSSSPVVTCKVASLKKYIYRAIGENRQVSEGGGATQTHIAHSTLTHTHTSLMDAGWSSGASPSTQHRTGAATHAT